MMVSNSYIILISTFSLHGKKGDAAKSIFKMCFHFQSIKFGGQEFYISPQVRLKMNDKKPSKFQFYFSGVLEAFSMLKKWKKKFC